MDAPQNKDDLTYHMTAHLRMNAVYWGLTALCIMKHKEALDAGETIEYVMSCWDDEAGAHESPTSIPSSLSFPPRAHRARPRPTIAKPLNSKKVPLVHTQATTRTFSPR